MSANDTVSETHHDLLLTFERNAAHFKFIGQCFFVYALNESWSERIVHLKHSPHHPVRQFAIDHFVCHSSSNSSIRAIRDLHTLCAISRSLNFCGLPIAERGKSGTKRT